MAIEHSLPIGSKDDITENPKGADHDTPYRFGSTPSHRWTYPFTERQYIKLLILKSRVNEYVHSVDAPKCTTLVRREK